MLYESHEEPFVETSAFFQHQMYNTRDYVTFAASRTYTFLQLDHTPACHDAKATCQSRVRHEQVYCLEKQNIHLQTKFPLSPNDQDSEI